jgi:hypothetical protein
MPSPRGHPNALRGRCHVDSEHDLGWLLVPAWVTSTERS